MFPSFQLRYEERDAGPPPSCTTAADTLLVIMYYERVGMGLREVDLSPHPPASRPKCRTRHTTSEVGHIGSGNSTESNSLAPSRDRLRLQSPMEAPGRGRTEMRRRTSLTNTRQRGALWTIRTFLMSKAISINLRARFQEIALSPRAWKERE